MKIRYIIFGCVFLVITMFVRTTSAYLTSEATLLNPFAMGNVDVEIVETCFEEGHSWEINKNICKQVQIKNMNDHNALIRVQVIPYWIDEQGKTFGGDISSIQLNFENITTQYEKENQWVSGSDGFYYYSSVLPIEQLTSVLLTSVTLKEELPETYENKKLMIDVEAEAIQATQAAYQSAWSHVPKEIASMLEQLCKY